MLTIPPIKPTLHRFLEVGGGSFILSLSVFYLTVLANFIIAFAESILFFILNILIAICVLIDVFLVLF